MILKLCPNFQTFCRFYFFCLSPRRSTCVHQACAIQSGYGSDPSDPSTHGLLSFGRVRLTPSDWYLESSPVSAIGCYNVRPKQNRQRYELIHYRPTRPTHRTDQSDRSACGYLSPCRCPGKSLVCTYGGLWFHDHIVLLMVFVVACNFGAIENFNNRHRCEMFTRCQTQQFNNNLSMK